MKKISFLSPLFLFLTLYSSEYKSESAIENNFFISEKSLVYNRFRTFLDISNEDNEDFDTNLNLTLDVESFYDIKKDKKISDDEVSIYRGYVEYIDDIHQIGVGKQNIPLGIGKLFSPLNIFNPLNASSIEKDERSAINSLKYEYVINDLSNLLIVYAQDISTIRLKYVFNSTEIGIVAMTNTQNGVDESILGYELESRIFESSFDFKSEALFIKAIDNTKEEVMVGLDYGIGNLMLSLEYLYDSDNIKDSFATALVYQIDGYWSINIVELLNIKNRQNLSMPSIGYMLSDNHTLKIGSIFIFDINKKELLDDSYYLQLSMNF